ncbi:organic hydroperoxide reductase OsmC/OhrA [Geodermatophilus normandii]|uniref:Organic hydroperoxide reductase OsmC/OhrA n=1 Tax=Geodermatophilus normandii TaxID=1137989 RepID=A0A317QCR6_9ACTN|nr:hypothetical protein [Geodermatophilus normandii]PWW21478.1 organic hydroperoxide reductase OsmC/OhrA [Geodermatophilus normandii]
MDRLHTAEATAAGARTGQVRTSDGRLDVHLSRPAETGGDGGPGYSGLGVDPTARLPALDAEEGRALVERTHTICPHSRATRGDVEVGLHVAGD